MKTSYPLKSKDRRNAPIARSLKVFVFLIAVLFVINFFSPSFLGSLFSPIATPLWKSRDFLSGALKGISEPFYSKKNIISENESLKRRVLELESENLLLRIKTHELSFLEDALRVRVSDNSIFARVLSKPPQSPYDFLNVEVGEEQGISVGARVFSSGIAIGLVSEVGSKVSRVELFSRPGSEISAESLQTANTFVLKGRGGGNFETLVPSSVNLSVGEIFIIPGSQSFAVARLERIESRETDSFKKIFLSSPEAIFSLRFVEIER